MFAVTCEWTDRAKETKTNVLFGEYETFKMESHEDIKEMFMCYNKIVSGLATFGKIYTNEKHISKILQALPKEWVYVKTSICEAQKLHELTRTLMVYEIESN